MSAGIRNAILETYPDIADYLDAFLPKKDQFKVVKCHDHVELLINSSGDLLFWRRVEALLCVFVSNEVRLINVNLRRLRSMGFILTIHFIELLQTALLCQSL